jgi:outer membrane lipoprotein carrier protein
MEITMKKKHSVTLSYILLLTLLAFSSLVGMSKAEENVSSVKVQNEIETLANIDDAKMLVDVLSSTITYQADFKQSVFRDDSIDPDVTTGRFLIHRPSHFKWHTKVAYEQVIIADGDHLWTYDPDLEQVTIQNQKLVLTNSPLLLLTSGVDELVKAYEIQRIKNTLDTNELLFLLKPKENSLFESVHILIKDEKITELFLTDALGSKTTVEFSNVIRNKKIDVEEFVFKTPEGTDVIDSRESF